jgi:Phage-related protein, predicted endonuclease
MDNYDYYIRDPHIRLGATPDFVGFNEKGQMIVVEAKSVNCKFFDTLWQDGPPMMYIMQALVQGMLLGCDNIYIAAQVFNEALNTYIYEVPRDDVAEIKIYSAVKNFWQNFDAGIEPQITADDSVATLKALYPKADLNKCVDLTGNNRVLPLIKEREKYKQIIKENIDKVKEIDKELQSLMKDAETAYYNDDQIMTWKNQLRREVYIPAKTTRVFNVKKLKEME